MERCYFNGVPELRPKFWNFNGTAFQILELWNRTRWSVVPKPFLSPSSNSLLLLCWNKRGKKKMTFYFENSPQFCFLIQFLNGTVNWNWNGPGWNWNWNGTEFQNGTGTVNGTAKIVERFMPWLRQAGVPVRGWLSLSTRWPTWQANWLSPFSVSVSLPSPLAFSAHSLLPLAEARTAA